MEQIPDFFLRDKIEKNSSIIFLWNGDITSILIGCFWQE